MAEIAETRTKEFRHLLDTSSVDEALSAWRSWYPHQQSRGEGLRSVADPSTDPRWMSLLTLRLYAVLVAKMAFKQEVMTLSAEPELAVKAYQEFRLKQEERINETRALMDSLATSNWGSKVPGGLGCFVKF